MYFRCFGFYSFISIRNKESKGLLQVATKCNMTLTQYLCVYSVYIHTCIYTTYIHTDVCMYFILCNLLLRGYLLFLQLHIRLLCAILLNYLLKVVAAMLAQDMLRPCVRLSVRMSVTSRYCTKRLNVVSRKQRHAMAHGL